MKNKHLLCGLTDKQIDELADDGILETEIISQCWDSGEVEAIVDDQKVKVDNWGNVKTVK